MGEFHGRQNSWSTQVDARVGGGGGGGGGGVLRVPEHPPLGSEAYN